MQICTTYPYKDELITSVSIILYDDNNGKTENGEIMIDMCPGSKRGKDYLG